MTITYQKNVQNTSFMGFAKLLLKWRGSIYKLVFRELLLYGSAFTIVSVVYRVFMTDEQKRSFEKVALYCNETAGLMPMSFVLGFYVTFVVTRWWNQFLNLPWPDRFAHAVLMYVNGYDDRSRIFRRTLIRYVNLSTTILFQTISGSAVKRFPTMEHLVEAGLMTAEERHLFEGLDLRVNKYWAPYVWAINVVNEAVKEGKIAKGEPVKQLLDELNNLRSKAGLLWGHDWVTVPLVYTQVVTLLTHLFFLTCLISRQFLDPEQGYPGHGVDLYFPVYTFLQFFFFLGWLKVAEQLINPFGEDDDDFETNWFIDRNIQVGYAIVDHMYGVYGKLEKDAHWGDINLDIPYTEAALIHKIPEYKGSTMDFMEHVSQNGPNRKHSLMHTNTVAMQAQPPPTKYQQFKIFLKRNCCQCLKSDSPPMNKPIGESYGRTEPINFEHYDNAANRKLSNYSIFGDGYFQLINRSGKRESVTGDFKCPESAHLMKANRSASVISEPAGHQQDTHGVMTHGNSYVKRHRPSAVAAHVLASVSETEQEETESNSHSPTDTVKIALAYLDEDEEEDTPEKAQEKC